MKFENGFRDELEAELIARARNLRPLLARHGADNEERRSIHDEVIRALDAADIWAITAPQRWNGLGVSATTMARVGAEIAKSDPSTGWVYYVLSTGTWMASLVADKLQEEVFGNGMPRVCGGAAPPGRAVPTEGGYIVNGSWAYCSGCENATWGFFWAAIEMPDGTTKPGAMVYFPMSDVTIKRDWFVAGMKGTGSHSVIAKDVFVPEHRLIPPETPYGFHAPDKKFVGEPSDYWPMLPLLRATVLGPLVGIAEAVLEHVSERVKTKGITYTVYNHAADSQVVQRTIGRAATLIHTARLVTEDATRMLDAAALARQPMAFEDRARNKGQTSIVVEMLSEAVDKLMSVAGSSAFFESNDLQRYWRDLNVAARHANLLPEVGYEIFGKALLGIEPNIVPPQAI